MEARPGWSAAGQRVEPITNVKNLYFSWQTGS